jgi:hypothetical protein
MRSPLSLFFSVLSCVLFGQLPETDIWIFDVAKDKSGQTILKNGKNFTSRTGYDNQPSFSADGKTIYYSSVREDRQADVYCYELKSGKIKNLYTSSESEYSPTPVKNGSVLATVTVESDSSQRIHFKDLRTGSDSRYEFDSVGYFLPLNDDTMIYFKLSNPHSLRFYCHSTGEDKYICSSPVRSIKAKDRSSFVFGIKDSARVDFYVYDFLLRKAQKYGSHASDGEDFFWHPSWGLLKSQDALLLKYDALSQKWITLFDLSVWGLGKASRFAFSANNRNLIVVENK